MRTPFRSSSALFTTALLASLSSIPFLHAADSATSSAPTDPLAWPEVKQEHKPWTRWWWMGSAVDKENLTRELTDFAAAGLGGVEITPIYGAKGYEDRFIDFLSPKYVEILAHTAAEGKRLGIAIDMATGTGWPFGGSFTQPKDAELKIEIKDGQFAPKLTGFKVKRAAPGAAGLVLDPYSPEAIARYLAHFDQALAALPPGAIHGHFHDSFEYTANWTPALLQKFKALHGYDLADHMAELTGTGDPDTIARIKSDYREVLAQLHMDYMHTWGDWVRSHGGVVRNQGHGAPANLLDLYALADIPETEVFGATKFPIPGYRFTSGEISYNETQPLINRFASSAAHVTGKPLISSETFTWAREHFHEAPSVLKPELDQLFLTGINHVFYHGTAYSPSDAPWPGWLFYASTQYNNRNPLWRDINEGLNAYITRAQSLLQSGQPDADVLVYWPFHDLLHKADGWERKFSMHGKDWLTDSPTGKLAQQLIDAGIQFDFASDAQFQGTRVTKGGIETATGTHYRVILIPQTKLMPVETLRHLLDLADKGATILFLEAFPTDVPGLSTLDDRRAQFAKQLDRLKSETPSKPSSVPAIPIYSNKVGHGSVSLLEANVFSDTALATIALSRREPHVDHGLGFIRRRLDDGHVYFITNLTGKVFDGTIGLSVGDSGAAFFDARTGVIGVATSESILAADKVRKTPLGEFGSFTNATLHTRLQLAPGESIFVRTFAENQPTGPDWKYLDPIAPPTPLTGDWRVTFLHGGPELPPAFTIANTKLASWTGQSPAHEAFAGTARYELDFDLPTAPAGASGDWLLDLGDVRETARVFVNGTEVDLLWSFPFRTRIDAKHFKPGRNTLAIEVTNLAANRIRDLDKRGVKWANFYDANVVNVNYKKMDAANWPVMPAGLLGPVTLTPLK
jgi:hypothetical protein